MCRCRAHSQLCVLWHAHNYFGCGCGLRFLWCILPLHQFQVHHVVTVDLLLQAEPLDEVSLKKLLLQFEKRLYRNQELRIKFPDMPEKYVFIVSLEVCEVQLIDTLLLLLQDHFAYATLKVFIIYDAFLIEAT